MEMTRERIIDTVLHGGGVSYKNLSICDLADYQPLRKEFSKPLYQVYLSGGDHGLPHVSETYRNLGEAVNRFSELRKIVRRKIYTKKVDNNG
jgi:hypothetical protein